MEESQKVIEINPAPKWKRLLLFLGDYFIAFILSFVLFNLAIFPLSKVIFNTQKQSEQITALEEQSNDLLADSGFLFQKPGDKNVFENHVNFTFKVFLSYYAFNEEKVDDRNPQYGHKTGNDVIYNYYVDYLHDETTYLNLFKEVNQEDMLFDISDSISSISLKSDYKTLLGAELLEQEDEEKYSENMLKFRDHVFARLFYLHLYQDILDNDYVKDDISYNNCLKQIASITHSLQWIAVGASLVTVVISWSGVFLLYPLIHPDRRTIALSMMHLDRVDNHRFMTVSRGNVAIQSFYYFILNLSSAFFLPILYFGFAYCFNLPLLFFFTLISIALMIASMFIVLFNQYNRSGVDLLTSSVILPTSELERMFQEKMNHE